MYETIKIEKKLVDLSSELFLFNYITKQFGKENLIQIPRILFFTNLYDDKGENIYEKDNDSNKLNNKIEGTVCKIYDYVGVLEIDGAFKYIGDNIKLEIE